MVNIKGQYIPISWESIGSTPIPYHIKRSSYKGYYFGFPSQ
jgi:hypothetical protein